MEVDMLWLLANLALAGLQPPPPPGPPPLDLILDRVDQLDLDPETAADVADLASRERPAIDRADDRVRAAHQALRRAMEADRPDAAVVFSLADDLSDAQQQATRLHLTFELDLRALLTPDQWKRAAPPPPPGSPPPGVR